jgi:C1A family cysteine protease
MHAYGVCPEEMWNYKSDNFAESPSREAYDFGRHHKSIIYARVPQDLIQLKQCLIEGYLFAFGMSVYSNFESDETEKTGFLNVPSENDEYRGGHAVCAVGFDDERSIFIVRNSWGEQWGDCGYFYLPYAYMLDKNLVYDIWTFRNGKETFTLTIKTNKKRNACTII